MKKGRFLWSAHRITERQKAGKARNIKGKQLKNSRNTVSKPQDVLLSFQNVKIICGQNAYQKARNACIQGLFYMRKSSRSSVENSSYQVKFLEFRC